MMVARHRIAVLRTTGLFLITAVAEILGCYLTDVVVKQQRPLWLLVPAALSLALFAWLLTLHPTASGRVYAAYGAVYVAVALIWLRMVDGSPFTGRDLLGSVVVLSGMGILMGRAPQ
jgi:small multidrug resistance family-3 protein